jgi:hypothetical protein
MFATFLRRLYRREVWESSAEGWEREAEAAPADKSTPVLHNSVWEARCNTRQLVAAHTDRSIPPPPPKPPQPPLQRKRPRPEGGAARGAAGTEEAMHKRQRAVELVSAAPQAESYPLLLFDNVDETPATEAGL